MHEVNHIFSMHAHDVKHRLEMLLRQRLSPTLSVSMVSTLARYLLSSNLWRRLQRLICQVKPNLGHSEGASGISGVIKMVLALEHRVIPPNINYNKPNPRSKPSADSSIVHES